MTDAAHCDAAWSHLDANAFRWARVLARPHGGALLLLGVALGIALATRAARVLASLDDLSWDRSLLATFGWGALFDIGAVLLVLSPVALLLAVLPGGIFRFRLADAAFFEKEGFGALQFSAKYREKKQGRAATR